MIELRRAETDADLEAWRQVKLRVLPGERAPTVDELRAQADRRVLPEHRRRGVGTALLHELAAHCAGLGFRKAGALVDGADAGSVAFAKRFGFKEQRRDVEQVRILGAEDPPPPPPPPPPEGVEIVAVAERPALLREAYELANEGYVDMHIGDLRISLEQWLREEATLPAASFVALAEGEIVGACGPHVLARGSDAGRARADGRSPGLARPGSRPRPEAAADLVGGCKRAQRARYLDPAGEREHAAGQRAARLRVPRPNVGDGGAPASAPAVNRRPALGAYYLYEGASV